MYVRKVRGNPMNKNLFFMLLVAVVTLPACLVSKKKDAAVETTTFCGQDHNDKHIENAKI